MDIAASIEFLRENGLTYCGRAGKLETLHQLVTQIEAKAVSGIFIEAGVAMGGSASIIAKCKSKARELYLFDVFDMLPPPAEADGQRAMEVYEYFRSGNVQGLADINYVTHANDMLSFVHETMRRLGVEPEALNIHFVKGLYANTLHVKLPVAFAHIDCDWYDSVKLCITRIADHLSPGGIMLFDDYHSFEGCRLAVDEWLATDSRFKVIHSDWTVAIERAATAS
jgi:Macrocin-O-methyltransferase (TylF)